MRMNFGEVYEIEDLGNHPAVTVIELGLLLACDVHVTPDPGHKEFYEIDSVRTTYCVYSRPTATTIFLIAALGKTGWPMPELAIATNVPV
jgi:hypothetical protein